MKFFCERAPLLTALAAAVRIVSSRTTIPILANVLVEADAEGVAITTTDLDRRVTARVAAEVERLGATTLPAKILHDVVRAAPADGRLTVDAPEGERATLRHGRSRQALSTLPVSDYPQGGVGDTPHAFALPGAVLAQLLARCLIAVSSEETRYYLCGVLFHAHEGPDGLELRMVATDGHRMVVASPPLPDGAAGLPRIILPREACVEVQRLAAAAAGPVLCAFGERLVRFKFPSGLHFTTKTVDGTFPDYERVIPVGNPKVALVPRGPLAAALDRVVLVRDAESRGGAVRFTLIGDGALTLRMTTPLNEAVEQIDAETEDQFETGFNPTYLKALLPAVEGETISFHLADAGSPALIRAVGDAAAMCVLMPQRL